MLVVPTVSSKSLVVSVRVRAFIFFTATHAVKLTGAKMQNPASRARSRLIFVQQREPLHQMREFFFLPTHIHEIFPHCSFCRPQYLFPHYFGLQDSPTQTLFVSSAAGLSSQPKTLNYLVIKKRQLNCLFPNSNLGNCI